MASSWAVRRAVAELAHGLPQALPVGDALQLSVTAFDDVYDQDGERGDSFGAAVSSRSAAAHAFAAAARHLSSARILSSPNVRPSAMSDSGSAIDSLIRGTERQKLVSSLRSRSNNPPEPS